MTIFLLRSLRRSTIISQPFRFVKRFFESFLNLFSNSLCQPPSSARLAHYTTSSSVCQYLFSNFFEFFRDFFHRPNPPSTPSTCPVTKDAASEAKKATTSATSSGVPMRQSGVSSRKACKVSSSKQRFISVAMTPGSTQLTVMPEGPSYLASARVRPSIPALVAE